MNFNNIQKIKKLRKRFSWNLRSARRNGRLKQLAGVFFPVVDIGRGRGNHLSWVVGPFLSLARPENEINHRPQNIKRSADVENVGPFTRRPLCQVKIKTEWLGQLQIKSIRDIPIESSEYRRREIGDGDGRNEPRNGSYRVRDALEWSIDNFIEIVKTVM